MLYSGLSKALVLSVALSACAHSAGSGHTATNTPATHVETAGQRTTDGPSFTRLRAAYLAGESRPASVTGGAVVVERQNCDVWAAEAADRCDLSALANESMAFGAAPTW
jgi:hypothetical protein